MPQFVKMGIGTQGYMPKAGSSLRAKRRRAARRAVMPGFPWLGSFASVDDVAAYFAPERIQCLLCGRLFGRLGGHLPRIHGVSEDAYRARYGLPWRRGLTGASAHDRYVAAGNNADMDRMRALSAEFRSLAHTARQRPRAAPQVAQMKQRILAASGAIEFRDEHFAGFLAAIGTGMTPSEVAALPNMPALNTWRHKRSVDPSYDAQFKAIWESLPFSVQARGQRLGVRFEQECERLFREGKPDWKIAEILGVTTMTVNHRTRKWRHAHRPKVLDITNGSRG